MNVTEIEKLYAGFAEPLLPFPYLVTVILAVLPLSAFLGFLLGRFEFRHHGYADLPNQQIPGATSLGALLALLGLLLGFAFSSALDWREARQSALIEEASAISTAFYTADLLEEPGNTYIRERILAYARTRLASHEDVRTKEKWNAFLKRTLDAQAEIWPATMRAIGQAASDPIRVAVARSVTDMLDAHNRRIAAAAQQIPPAAQLMILLASITAVLIMSNRTALLGRPLTWRTFAFAGLLSVVMIVILDLDQTLEGTIRLNPDTLIATIHELDAAMRAPSD